MFTLTNVASLIRAGSSRTDGNKTIADFDRQVVSEKAITLLRTDASKVTAPRGGERLAFQVHTSPAALLALAVEALESGHKSVYLTLTTDIAAARTAVKAAKAPAKPEPAAEPAVEPAAETPKAAGSAVAEKLIKLGLIETE